MEGVALLLPAESFVVLDASLLWELALGDELVTVVLPVTNPKTVDAAVAAGLVIMEADEGDDELRLGATLVVALHEDVEEVFLVLLVDSGTMRAEEAKLVFNVAMCYQN